MCLAIAKPRGETIPLDALQSGFLDNPDGAGYAYAFQGKLVIRKGFFTLDHFLENYLDEVWDTDAAIVHFRLATSGKVNKRNCHPFWVTEKLAVAHNGVLPWRSTVKYSDTACFTHDILRKCGENLTSNAFLRVLGEVIGAHNKLVFLDSTGALKICNEPSGTWENGIWYSNTRWQGCPLVDWTQPDDPDDPNYDPSYDAWAWDSTRLDRYDYRY